MKNRAWASALFVAAACTDNTAPRDPLEIAVRLAAASQTSQQAVANTLVADLPTVIAYDSHNVPVARVAVTFAIESGVDGTIEHSVDTTDASGIAQLRFWRVGTRARVTNTVSARMTRGDPVLFSATVIPGSAVNLEKLEGDNQMVQVNHQVRVRPRARLIDAYDNPVPQQAVTFQVTRGGGSIAVMSAETDSLGTVTAPEWTAGAAGSQQLLFTASGRAASFNATAINATLDCTNPTELIANLPTASSQFSAECNRDNRKYNIYYFVSSSSATWAFAMQSSETFPYLELRDANSRLIAKGSLINDSTGSQLLATIPDGTYQLIAMTNSSSAQVRVTAKQGYPATSGCDGLYVTRGTVLYTGILQLLLCDGEPPAYGSLYRMHLEAGESVEIGLYDASYSGSRFDVLNEQGDALATEEVPTQDFFYTERYTARVDVDIVVRVTSLEDFAQYDIRFK